MKMMPWEDSGLLTVLIGTFMLTLICGHLYRRDRRAFLGYWALGWAAWMFYYALRVAIEYWGDFLLLHLVCQLFSLTAAQLFFVGCLKFTGASTSRLWKVVFISMLAAVVGSALLGASYLVIAAIVAPYLLVMYVGTGVVILRYKDAARSVTFVAGLSFILVGVIQSTNPWQFVMPSLALWSFRLGAVVGSFLILGMLAFYFERMIKESAIGLDRYRLLAENARDVIFRARLGPELVIEYVSPSVEVLTGFSPEDFYTDKAILAKIISPPDLIQLERFLNSLLCAPYGEVDFRGAVYSLGMIPAEDGRLGGLFNLQLHHQDGRVVHTEQQVVFEKADGKGVVAAEGICRDITERRQAEWEQEQLRDQLLKSQKMEALGSLAGGVAHDMNNILSAIMGVASLLGRRLRKNPEVTSLLDTVVESCKRGRDLTGNLLGFSRRTVARKEKVSLNLAAKNVANILAATLPKSITLKTRLAPNLSAVEGDSAQLEQLLMNLCLNAADSIDGSGTIEIVTSEHGFFGDDLEVAPELKAGEYVILEVIDDGSGMEPETVERAFEPFFTTKEPGQGTGLGLSMVYGTARSHGGGVEIKSKKGLGTKVAIYLPSSGVLADEPKENKDSAHLNLGNWTVLVVDDEEMIRSTNREMLEELGLRVLIAESGEDACRIFEDRRREISLVMLDVAMPGMDGIQTLEKLRNIDRRVQVLFATAYDRDTLSRELGTDDVPALLKKPYTLKDLSMALGREIEST